MPRASSRLLLLSAAVGVLLAGCASSPDAGTEPSSVPDGSETESPAPSSSESVEPTESAEPEWQTITTPDGATFEIPAEWTTEDVSVENEIGTIVAVDVLDADGSRVLTYQHDEGGLGGLGGACDSHPASQVLGQWELDESFETMATDGTTVLAAYGVEQPDGTVDVSVGYVNDETFASSMCLTYNDFLAPDGMWASFASAFTGGVEDAPDGEQPALDPMWTFASFDEAQAFVDAEEGQTIVQVLQSLEMPAA